MLKWFGRFQPSSAHFAMLLVAAAVCAWATPASAQLGEMHGYVEPCTVDNAQEWYTECELCAVSPGNPQGCANRFSPLGYKKNCQTRGHGTGSSEVWCVDKKLAQARADSAKRAARLQILLGLAGIALPVAVFLLIRRVRARRRSP